MTTILSCVAFLEAVVNEVLKDAADDHLTYVSAVPEGTRMALAAYWHEGMGQQKLLEKYQVALALAHEQPFDRGAQPYQDAALLIKVRNELVHYKPDTRFAHEPTNLERQLEGKFRPSGITTTPGNPYFPDRALGAGCTEWAVAASSCFADEFCRRLKVVPNYRRFDWERYPPLEVASVEG